jgi:hypothetical protein
MVLSANLLRAGYLCSGKPMPEATQVTIHATGQLDRVATALERLSPRIREGLPGGGKILLEELVPSSDVYRLCFRESVPVRARMFATAERIGVGIDVLRVPSDTGLWGLLSHELSHVVQYVKRGPLHFRDWTWLTDAGAYCARVQVVFHTFFERCGINQRVSPDSPEVLEIARNFLRLFVDVDVHRFMFAQGVLEFPAYEETIEDFVENRSGPDSLTLAQLYSDCQKKGRSRPHTRYMLATMIFLEWMHMAGGRWGKLGPLADQPEAERLIGKYCKREQEMFSARLGEFANADIVETSWRELVRHGEDTGKIWGSFKRLAVESVRSAGIIMGG